MEGKNLDQIDNYYSEKISEHGPTPEGVDWNGAASQAIRFDQSAKIIEEDNFSINDLGCGYGAFNHYLSKRYKNFQYFGVDLSRQMIASAQSENKRENTKFTQGSTLYNTSDYSVASGIFSVKLAHSERVWEEYIKSTIRHLSENSRKGVAFNCLTSYSDTEKMKDHLYYADPSRLFSYCKDNFSKNVALLHDYALYEFTVLIRK
jgi:SAM-dependent methyltransferase